MSLCQVQDVFVDADKGDGPGCREFVLNDWKRSCLLFLYVKPESTHSGFQLPRVHRARVVGIEEVECLAHVDLCISQTRGISQSSIEIVILKR